MDCRMSLLAALCMALGTGCVTTQNAQPPGSSEPPPGTVFDKSKDGPKRPPLPGTVVALAIIKECEAERTKDAALQGKLYDEARQQFQNALLLDPKYRDAIQGVARVYTRMNDFEHALETYRKALDKNPKDHGLWFDLGMCYNRKKDFAEAIPCFEKALDLDRENHAYMRNLGFTLARTGQVEQGLSFLTKAMGTAASALQPGKDARAHGAARPVP